MLQIYKKIAEPIALKRAFITFLGLLLCAQVQIFAQSNKKVTIKQNKITVVEALKFVEKQTKISINYSDSELSGKFVSELNLQNKSVTDALDVILKGTGFMYQIHGNYILITKKRTADKQDSKIIKGQVIDDHGEPLIGVNISIGGGTNGTITDVDGNFVIKTSSDASLKVSYIGYITQTISASKQDFLKVVLKQDTKVLDEVVVTALGIKRSEKALSYNVQQIKGDELTTVKSTNFVNSLNGKIAGVNINASASGSGGATRVIMRGTKSIASNNGALYVIDGIPIFNVNNGSTAGAFSLQPSSEGISDINPDDIESMSVLSGPAAAALYGSNAAQGVILINTKKGQEGKVKVTIANSTTFATPFKMPDFQNVYANRPGEFASWGEKNASYNYQPKKFFKTGTDVQNNVSLSVGNSKNQSYLSVGTTNANGMILNNKYNRYNFTFRNTTSFLNDKMKFDASISFIKQDNQNMMAQGQYYNPLLAVYLYPRGENFDDVRLFEEFDEGRQINIQRWAWGTQDMDMQNPYWIAKRNLYGNIKNRYMLNASLSYDVYKWLNVAGRVRADNSFSDNYRKNYASTAELFAGAKGFYSFSKSNDKQLYADLIANINTRFNDFSLSANIGASFTNSSNDLSGFQGELKDMPNVFNYFNIDFKNGRDSYPLQSGWEQETHSVFASSELGWKSMLYLTVTARNDWDSALAKTVKKSFFYPSVGLSTVVSEMVELPKTISYLKVRASYASVGSAIPRGLSQPKYSWDPATAAWHTITVRPLGKIYPETTNSWELGLNARLFNNMVNLDVTWYKSNTKNQFFSVPISASTGFSSMYAQAGNVQNTGMEFALGLNKEWQDFSWSSNLTYSFNKNKVVELLDHYQDALSGETHSINMMNQGGIGASSFILTKNGTMGDLYVSKELVRDNEGNLQIKNDNVVVKSLTEQKKVGSVLPKSNLGFRNDFSWRNISFGFLLTARFGGIVLSHTQALLDKYGVSKTSANARDDGGIPINNGIIDSEKYYSVVGGSDGVLSQYVYSATNVRLQEASLGYTFPAKWFNNKLNVNLSIIGRNLLMIYCKAPFDPELTPSTGTYNQGLDYFMQPSQRNIGFNVKFQF